MAAASKAKHANNVLDALRRRNHARNVPAAGGMTEVILSVILANGSSLTAARKALATIKESIVNWNELRVTQPWEIVIFLEGIKDAEGKANAIHDVLSNVFEGTHDLDMAFLEGASAEEARDFLSGLGGLTEEMVNEIILSGRGHFTMAADTDVSRVAQRLGLAGRGTSPSKLQDELESSIGGEKAYQMLYLLKCLSETVCGARSSRCVECVLPGLCPAGKKSKSK
jgi:endonuclease III